MKKTYYIDGETLYVGIERIYGEWLLTTGGDPVTLYVDEEANDEFSLREIEEIDNIICDPSTEWEECDEDDIEYINRWLEIWGI